MATIFTPVSDVWIKGHDQFGNTCWYNKETYELHYFYASPRQPVALPPRGNYLTEAPRPHPFPSTGQYFTPASKSPAEMPRPLDGVSKAYVSQQHQRADGGRQERVTHSPKIGSAADGVSKAYVSQQHQRADGGRQERVTHSPKNGSATDGVSKAYVSQQHQRADGGRQERVTYSPKIGSATLPFNNMALQGESRGRAKLPNIPIKQEEKSPARKNTPVKNIAASSNGQDIRHQKAEKKVLHERAFSTNNNPTQRKKVFNEPTGETLGIVPGKNNFRTLPPFPQNNATHPTVHPQEMILPPPKMAPKKEDKNQWRIQVNEKGDKYYLNTKTSEWQMETPDCFKKYSAKW